jgi:NitT/TauT family transport system permease protein
MIRWIIPLLGAALWFAASQTGIVPAYLLPHPFRVAEAGWSYIWGASGAGPYAGRFAGDLAASLGRVGAGFALAAALGLPLGILSGRVRMARELLDGTINAARAVPGISWLPLAMVWLGIGTRTTIFLVALAAFFPIYLNAAAGARNVDPLILQAGAMMGAGKLRSAFDILLPAAMPHIVTGLRLGLGISWAYLVLGELSGVPDGLGAVIMDARMSGDIEMIVVGVIVIAVVGKASDALLKLTLRTCFRSARRMLQ